jgi:small subunit ribosomal protein S16
VRTLSPAAVVSTRDVGGGAPLRDGISPVINDTGDSTPVAVKIKLKRMGKIRNPQYRIIVADARTKRDGRAIEQIGKYHPKEEPSLIQVDSERAQYWLGVGAQPTEPVLALLKVTGDWQKYKGLPGAEGTLKLKEPRSEKRMRFDAALADAHGDAKTEPTTPRKRAKKAAEKPAKAADSTEQAEKPAKAAAKTAEKATKTAERATRTAEKAAAKTAEAASAETDDKPAEASKPAKKAAKAKAEAEPAVDATEVAETSTEG